MLGYLELSELIPARFLLSLHSVPFLLQINVHTLLCLNNSLSFLATVLICLSVQKDISDLAWGFVLFGLPAQQGPVRKKCFSVLF